MTKKTDKKPTKKCQISELKSQLDIERELKLRALADLQNFRRRENENKKNWSNFAIAEFCKNMIPTLRELKIGAEHTSDEDLKKTIMKFFAKLEKSGLMEISPQTGENLDPHIHEVLLSEKGKSGTIVRVLESGWKFGEITIASAKVSAAE